MAVVAVLVSLTGPQAGDAAGGGEQRSLLSFDLENVPERKPSLIARIKAEVVWAGGEEEALAGERPAAEVLNGDWP